MTGQLACTHTGQHVDTFSDSDTGTYPQLLHPSLNFIDCGVEFRSWVLSLQSALYWTVLCRTVLHCIALHCMSRSVLSLLISLLTVMMKKRCLFLIFTTLSSSYSITPIPSTSMLRSEYDRAAISREREEREECLWTPAEHVLSHARYSSHHTEQRDAKWVRRIQCRVFVYVPNLRVRWATL